MRVSEIFSKVCELAIALGHKQINKIPGCLEIRIDEQWWFAINAHSEPTKCSERTEVPPMGIYFMFNGWPAGIVQASGGCLAGGAAANEDTLIKAINARLAAISGEMR